MADSSRPNTTLYVSNLDPTVTSTTLSELFIPFGEITSITLPKPTAPSDTAPHRGFGYVEFEELVDAKEAIANMDQAEIYGRVVKVAWAKEEARRDGEGAGVGSTVAVWEREGYKEKYGGGVTDIEVDEKGGEEGDGKAEDPMQGLEGLDVAGPRVA